MDALQWVDLVFAVLAAAIVAGLLVALRNGLASLGLYMDRSEGEAMVEAEYRVLWLFRRVRYRIWTPGGMVVGTAPARLARDGKVLVAWRPAHPQWHRPRELMLDDVLLALTFCLSGLVMLLLHGAAAIWRLIHPGSDARG